jgi:acetyl esterase/lipase
MDLQGKSLIYFSLEYPLAPQAKYPEIMHSALAAYFWLVQQVGVKNIVIGGDSGGANLVLSLHKQLLLEKRNNLSIVMPKSLVLISPWLDISLSHTPPHIIEQLSSTSDFLPYKMLEKWRDNVTPHGVSPRDPSMSPFFDLDPLVMPRDGILLIYGSTEVFAPEIDDWVTSIRKQPEARSKLK